MGESENEKYDWVQILDPKSHQLMYINLTTGECCRDPVKNMRFKPLSPNQWWELYDVNLQRNYYHNSTTLETVWQKPEHGDIIPLSKLQDIGVLRRSNVSSRKAQLCKPSLVTQEGSNFATNGQDIRARSSQTDGISNHIRSNSIDSQPLTDEKHAFDLNSFLHHHHHHHHHNAAQLTDPNPPPSSTISFGPRNSGSQRVRDWLRDSSTTSEKPLLEVSEVEESDKISSTNPKKSGCLSDKPVRRHYTMALSYPQNSVDQELNNPSTDNSTSKLLSSETPQICSIPLSSHSGTNLNTNGCGINRCVNHCLPPLSNTNVNSSNLSQDRISCSNAQTSVSESLSRRQDYFISTNSLHNSKLVDQPHLSPDSVPVTMIGIPDNPISQNLAHKFASLDPSFNALTSLTNHHTPQPIPRQRAFPRTNPSVSRSSGPCTLPRGSSNSTSSPNSPFLFPNQLHHSTDPWCPKTAVVDINISGFQTPHSLNSNPLRPTFFNEELHPLPNNHLMAFSPLKLENSIGAVGTNVSPLSVETMNAYFNPALQSNLCHYPAIKPDFTTSVSVDSPLTESPQPSSSSSHSFSGASSATALTTANSDESLDMPTKEPPTTDQKLVQNSLDDKANFETPNLPDQYLPSSMSNNVIPNEDQLRPPTPPPRSASTLCSQGFSTTNRMGNGNLEATNSRVIPIPSSLGFPHQFHPLSQFQYMSMTPDENLVSSLSRNHPSRSNVIQPHRRQNRPQYYTQQFPTVSPFESLSPVDLGNNSNPTVSQTPQFLINKSNLINQDLVHSNSEHPTRTSTSNMSVSNESDRLLTSNSSTITSLATSSRSSRLGSDTNHQTESTDLSTNKLTQRSASLTGILKRSASGGFIGPGEISEGGMWMSSHNHRMRLQLPSIFAQLSQIQPGHPAYATLTAPFDWPKHLFKPDLDINTSMSWTKSKFTKRLLVATDPSMKKQVAGLFKTLQSFMGDRKARLSFPDYCSIIIHRALGTAQLRDELYAQLCKQTTNNPDGKSLTNGWALLCVCLYYFPPNSKFRDYLSSYLSTRAEVVNSIVCHTGHVPASSVCLTQTESSLKAAAAIASGLGPLYNPDPTIVQPLSTKTWDSRNLAKPTGQQDNMISDFRTNNHVPNRFDIVLSPWDRPGAAHFARVAPRWFVRALSVGPRKTSVTPTIDEICHVKDFILKPCIFGSSLGEMMQIQTYRFPNLKIPWIQIFLTEELLRLGGAQTEGIFRLSPDMDLLIEIRCQLERLFEIFRVVQLCDTDSPTITNSNPSDPDSAPDRFHIFRPPPVGWSSFARPSESEDENLSDLQGDLSKPNSLSYACSNIVHLTGHYQWPLLPEPLSSPPAEYVIPTPTAHWPRSLMAMVKLCTVNSTESSTTTACGNQSIVVEPHLAAGLLKMWLRELSEPLIPVDLQPICLKAACEAEAYESQQQQQITTNQSSGDDEHISQDRNDAMKESGHSNSDTVNPIQKCCQLVRRLPHQTRRSMLYLILLLQHLSHPSYVCTSLMDARNLATVVAPNLMRSTSKDPRELLEAIRPQTLFVRLLITHLDVQAEIDQLVSEEQETNISESSITAPKHYNPPIRVKLGPGGAFVPL